MLTVSQILGNNGVTLLDEQTQIQAAEVDPDSSNLKCSTSCAHQKCGHLGETTYRWAQDRGISLTIHLIKFVILQRPISQQLSIEACHNQ